LVLGRYWWKAPSAFPPYVTTQALILNGWFGSAPLLVEGALGFSTLHHYPGVNFKWVVWFWGVIGGRRCAFPPYVFIGVPLTQYV